MVATAAHVDVMSWLPDELLVEVLVHVLPGLKETPRTNSAFARVCRSPGFWLAALRERGWMPDWSSDANRPGGMHPKAYSEMVCGLDEPFKTRLVGLTRETTTIKYGAFRDCTSLALKELPPTLTTIEEFAFSGCTSLKLKELPPALTTIKYGAFWGCTSLALEKLPPKLTTIGDGAFRDCTSLQENAEFVAAVKAIQPLAFK